MVATRVRLRKSPGGAPPPAFPPLDTGAFEVYLLGGFGGTTQPNWDGHFNNLIDNLWPNYRDLGQIPYMGGGVMQYDPCRLALLAWYFFGQVRGTWDARFIAAAEAGAHIWHKFYTENGVLAEYLSQTTGLAMLHKLDPVLYPWCLDALQVYYDHYDGSYRNPTWHRREIYCRESSYVLRALFNFFARHPDGFDHAGHAAGQNYHSWVLETLTHYPRQWLNEWQQPWAGGFASILEYGCRVGNLQNWQYWTGTLSSPSTTVHLQSLNHFMMALWFDTAAAVYLHDPDYAGSIPLLQDMIDLADLVQTESWDATNQKLWWEIGSCRTEFYQVEGHYPADQCSGGSYPNHGWGDSRPYSVSSLDLTAFSLNMCGFLWHVTADQKWLDYGDRNWYAFWNGLGNPLNSNQLWSAGGKQFCESVTACTKYLKWRDYPTLTTDIDVLAA